MASPITANEQKYTRNSRIARWHLDSVLQAIYDLLATTGATSILDAGCGEGFVTGYLAARDSTLSLTGVDLNQAAIDYAARRFGKHARFQTGSVYKLPFSDKSFDLVLCSEVLEHLSDPNFAVRELKRVAQSYVLVTVPREPLFKWTNDLSRALGFSMDPGHVNFWTVTSFRKYIRAHFADPTFARKHLIYQLALGRP